MSYKNVNHLQFFLLPFKPESQKDLVNIETRPYTISLSRGQVGGSRILVTYGKDIFSGEKEDKPNGKTKGAQKLTAVA